MTGEPVFVKVLLEPSTKQLAAEGENGKQLEEAACYERRDRGCPVSAGGRGGRHSRGRKSLWKSPEAKESL